MTEQQLNEILADCEKQRGQIEIGGLFICFLIAGLILWLTVANSWWGLLFLLAPAAVGHELWAQFKAAMSDKNAWHFWDEFMRRYYGGEHVLSGGAAGVQRLSQRIRALYESDGTSRTLPVRMAARLLDTYNKQAHLSAQIRKRLQENESIYKKLNENINRLTELETTHESGQNSLRELEADRDKLQRVQANIETSMRHLEGVLERAEIEAQKRVLHAEVTKLTQTVKTTTSTEDPEIYIGEVVSDLEQQISSEVAHYFRLEQEIEAQLR